MDIFIFAGLRKVLSPAGSDPDIVMIRSTNGGTTWSTPVRVNNDALNNGKDQYYPWCAVDQSNGQCCKLFFMITETLQVIAQVSLWQHPLMVA